MWWVDCYSHFGAHRLVRGPLILPGKFNRTGDYGPLPSWADFDLKSDELGASRGFEVIDARGWPLVSFRSRFRLADLGSAQWSAISYNRIPPTLIQRSFFPGNMRWTYLLTGDSWRHGIPIAPTKVAADPFGWNLAEARRSIPIDPIYHGFLFNTTFFAIALWAMWYGPLLVRSHIRRKRGRCLKCGYDLRGAEHEVCPECGRRVLSAITERSPR